MDIKNRYNEDIKKGDVSKTQTFLYHSFFGRLLLSILVLPFISKLGGWYMNSKLSKKRINKFIEKNKIDMNEYEEKEYVSYNDFFTRKIKNEKRIIDMNDDSLICPCDSKLSIHKISKNGIYNIKNSFYRISDLLDNESLAQKYENGYLLIFRLTVDDYHRYCYIDEGTKEKNNHIKGIFHTVNPIALENYDVYKRNSREYSVLHTKNFGDIVQIEVGALMVGKIDNYHQEYSFKKGEEKGKFLFGGSTICILIKDNVVEIDSDLLENSLNHFETTVKYGEKIGKRI